MIGFCCSERFVQHDTGADHPERPDRIRAICAAVRQAGLIDSPNAFPDFHLDFDLSPRKGLKLMELHPAEADLRWVELVHPQSHIQQVRQACAAGAMLDQGDTPVAPGSYETALLAAGAAIQCCDAVMCGKVRRAFAAVRPPGHHAEAARAMGFCLFNNIAIAARYLQAVYAAQRIAIVDFDVHHGNGTQAIFNSDPGVYVISLHEDPNVCYPHSGYAWEIGLGSGRGYTLNLPFPAGSTDVDYLKIIDSRVVPELDEFRPEVLLLSAGFDAHREDPLAQIELSEEGFELMTRSLAAVADRHCAGRVVSLLEGGYNLKALGRSVVFHLLGLAGK